MVEVRFAGNGRSGRGRPPCRSARREQQRRLLAYLALTPGDVRGVDGIIDALWPGDDVPVEPRQAIHTYVSRLRSALERTPSSGATAGTSSPWGAQHVDVGRFEALVREAADPGAPRERAVELLGEALSLWRGPALDGFETEEWARAMPSASTSCAVRRSTTAPRRCSRSAEPPRRSPISRRRPPRRRCASARMRC